MQSHQRNTTLDGVGIVQADTLNPAHILYRTTGTSRYARADSGFQNHLTGAAYNAERPIDNLRAVLLKKTRYRSIRDTGLTLRLAPCVLGGLFGRPWRPRTATPAGAGFALAQGGPQRLRGFGPEHAGQHLGEVLGEAVREVGIPARLIPVELVPPPRWDEPHGRRRVELPELG
jgi:hypothetical protein